MIEEYRTKRMRKSGVTTTWYQLQINGEILLKAKEVAEKRKTDVNELIIQAILKEIDEK